MANMKINRDELITTLTNKVKEMEAALSKYDDDYEKYKKDDAAWQSKVVKEALKKSEHITSVHVHNGYYQKNPWTISFDIPRDVVTARPESPECPEYSQHDVREVKQFLKFLMLSDDTHVTMTAALKDLAKYL